MTDKHSRTHAGILAARLVHRFQGRDFRLTDVGGRVLRELLA